MNILAQHGRGVEKPGTEQLADMVTLSVTPGGGRASTGPVATQAGSPHTHTEAWSFSLGGSSVCGFLHLFCFFLIHGV